MDGGYVLYSILSIVFCALLMHGLKTMNHKLIMPSLIYIPLSSIGIVIACSLYAAEISVEDSCGEPVYKIDKWGNRVVDYCPLTAAGYAQVAIGVLGGGGLGPPWQKYLAWQNRIGWLGRKEIDSLAEKNWKA